MANTKPARGMRDFLPSDVRKRNYVIGIIKEVYESYGFEPLETPSVENLETLTGKYGEEGNQLIFKILKRGEKLQEELSAGTIKNENELSDLALRYDLTVPLARVVANHKNDLPKFFKRYQIQPVWRADRPAKGRFREFYQCDVDAIGSNSMMVEAELISAVCEILERLGFEDYVIRLNHRDVLYDILNRLKVPTEKHSDALTVIDKLDKVSVSDAHKELLNRGILKDSADELIKLYEEAWAVWNRGVEMNRVLMGIVLKMVKVETLEKLKEILNLVQNPHLIVYPFLARGLSYYTGAIFEIVLTNGDFAGSIGGGGRYDGLIGMFGKEQIPACGFSLGLERILVVMEERGMFEKPIAEGKLKLDSADVVIASFEESLTSECLKLATELRENNLRVLVYPEANQKIKPEKYAKQINIPFVILVKENGLTENKFTLKNLQTDETELIAREAIAARIKR